MVQGAGDLFGGCRFGQKFVGLRVGAAIPGKAGGCDRRGFGGKHHDGDVAVSLVVFQGPADDQAVEFRHDHVEHDGIRRVGLDFLQALAPVVGHLHFEPGPFQDALDQGAMVGLVIHHQYPFFHVHGAYPRLDGTMVGPAAGPSVVRRHRIKPNSCVALISWRVRRTAGTPQGTECRAP